MVCAWYQAPIGNLLLGAENGALARLWLPGLAPEAFELGDDPALDQAARALEDYFTGQPVPDSLSLAPGGTPFQQAVWSALRAIPRGQTRTYGQLARQLGRPAAARAVGQACNRNPIPILIPCHRVVGATGALTGFAGGIPMKRALLALENN